MRAGQSVTVARVTQGEGLFNYADHSALTGAADKNLFGPLGFRHSSSFHAVDAAMGRNVLALAPPFISYQGWRRGMESLPVDFSDHHRQPQQDCELDEMDIVTVRS